MLSRKRLSTILLVALVFPFSLAALADEKPAQKQKQAPLRIGAVAYSPNVVTVFQGIRRYLNANGLPADYVLYSNYSALVGALERGEVDIAWNTPLAHAQYHVQCGCASQTLVMRDVDRNVRAVIVARADAGIDSLGDLPGKKLVLGSKNSAESTIVPVQYLQDQGVDFSKLDVLSLDGEVDGQGNPCSSPRHVLKALRQGRGAAGIITESVWKRAQAQQTATAPALKKVWTSPPFSHCVFTAASSFDKNVGRRFTELMVAMPANDPATADVLRLEGAKKWVTGSPEGFTALVEALQKRERATSKQ
jgi:phosphonate transport system substrate-binding protein